MMTIEERRAAMRLARMGIDERPRRCCAECWWYHGISGDESGLHDDPESPEGFCRHGDVESVTQASYGDCELYEGWLS